MEDLIFDQKISSETEGKSILSLTYMINLYVEVLN